MRWWICMYFLSFHDEQSNDGFFTTRSNLFFSVAHSENQTKFSLHGSIWKFRASFRLFSTLFIKMGSYCKQNWLYRTRRFSKLQKNGNSDRLLGRRLDNALVSWESRQRWSSRQVSMLEQEVLLLNVLWVDGQMKHRCATAQEWQN